MPHNVFSAKYSRTETILLSVLCCFWNETFSRFFKTIDFSHGTWHCCYLPETFTTMRCCNCSDRRDDATREHSCYCYLTVKMWIISAIVQYHICWGLHTPVYHPHTHTHTHTYTHTSEHPHTTYDHRNCGREIHHVFYKADVKQLRK
jgi:hypothetical protein